jgi:hypothetical protein
MYNRFSIHIYLQSLESSYMFKQNHFIPVNLSVDIENENLDFVSVHNNFHYQILCLMTTLEIINKGVNLEKNELNVGIYNWAKKSNKITNQTIEEEKGLLNVTFSFSNDEHKAIKSHIDIIERAGYMARKNTLISLVSEFDNLISNLIRLGFKTHPSILKKSSNKNTSYERVFESPTLDEFFDKLIEKEIEIVLRQSHSEQFNSIEKIFNLKDLRNILHWDKFIEVTERRNIFVHCDGKVSQQYLDICRKHKVDIPKDCKLGTILDVDSNYLVTSYLIFVTIALILTQKIWRHLKPKEKENADAIISQTCFTLIRSESYDSALELLEFTESNFFNDTTLDATRLTISLNKAQVYKWKGEAKTMEKILNKLDFSTCNYEFKLAELVLRDKFSEAVGLVRKIGTGSNYINEAAYREWPIFREFRQTSEFLDTFKIVFDREFNPTTEESLTVDKSYLEEDNSDLDNNQS